MGNVVWLQAWKDKAEVDAIAKRINHDCASGDFLVPLSEVAEYWRTSTEVVFDLAKVGFCGPVVYAVKEGSYYVSEKTMMDLADEDVESHNMTTLQHVIAQAKADGKCPVDPSAWLASNPDCLQVVRFRGTPKLTMRDVVSRLKKDCGYE